MNIAILGGGNAGFTFAAHMSLLGNDIYLYEKEEFQASIEKVKESKSIIITGKIEGEGAIQIVSTDMEEVVKDAEIIIISVPAFAQQHMFEEYLKFAKKGDLVLFLPGNYATLRFQHMLFERGLEESITLAESCSVPYAARKTGGNSVNLLDIKKSLPVAALPASRNNYVLEKLNLAWSGYFVEGKNVIASSLSNPNCVAHCATCALNAGWIESGKEFSFYWEGISPSVCKVLIEIDCERIKIGEALGIEIPSLKEIFSNLYGIDGDSLYNVIQKSRHGESGSPESLMSRYVEEDVPYGLVPISSFGRLLGIATPSTDAIIQISSVLNGKDYNRLGIDVNKLGLSEMTAENIIKQVSV